MNLLRSPYLLLVLTMLFWAGNGTLARGVRELTTPLGLNFWRWTLVLAMLLPFTWRQLWIARGAIARDWKILLALGGLGIASFNFLLYLALEFTTATNVAFITAGEPMMIVLLSWLLLREGLTLRQALGIALSMAGVLFIITQANPALLLQVRFNAGDLWSIAAALVWALYSVLLRHRPPELGPMPLLTVLVIIGVVLMLPFYLWLQATGTPVILTPATAAAVLYVSIFASLLGVAF